MSEETPINQIEPVEIVEAEKPIFTPVPVPTTSATGLPPSRLLQWWIGLFQKMSTSMAIQPLTMSSSRQNPFAQPTGSAKDEAKSRLQLVLMHDRTRLSPTLMESMRDELVEVISRYVEIDKSALDLSLEQESNTIALVANISVVRAINKENESAQAS